ncbi:hypothetical protein AYO21_06663 [Fonsecaea monophora]|uniref:Uncharacterized protein n=1 Tax=Fonsecaea monophora TaxID=254056 RepID=A0A177F6Q0_9EURO|nr:hypothetical protein AYO21_06663 [Fonsecaea monophora]KAH0842534.1 hypothetical protein FOPE_07271 [Fonsecaea pedrosoi]OAG39112.1 hypothetical protein AYO21_06663 [Fonsecaea monophora]
MAGVLEGLMSSRRRPSRSRSESTKQLHARWGDVAITAPNGGWTQHYLDDDMNNVAYQAHGSPDSQKTLVNTSPDLSFKDEIERGSVETIPQQSPPLIQKERGTITITIPLLWSRKSHRRSSSTNSQPLHQTQPARVVEKVVTAESRPVRPGIISNIDEVIVAEPRPAIEPFRVDSPIIHSQSPVYDDVSTFFTRAVFPEKHPGPPRLPQIQTSVPPNKSQPASAISILSPVVEKYNELSESNNATPMDNTPIARQIESAISHSHERQVDLAGLVDRLEGHVHTTPLIPSTSEPPSSDEAADPTIERPESGSSATRLPSRPSSRGPGIGEVAYMRASSRGPSESSGGRRSASREPAERRAGSVGPGRRRAVSREAPRRRADSPARGATASSFSRGSTGRRNASCEPSITRSLSRDPVRRRADSPPPVSRRALSREPAVRRADSPEPKTRRALSRGQAISGTVSPETITPRAFSDDKPIRPRAESPGPSTRRAVSREPYTRHRISGDFSARRATSVDPVVRRDSPPKDDITSRHASPRDDIFTRHASPRDDIFTRQASPRDDIVPRRGTPVVVAAMERDRDSAAGSSSPDELTPDEATDIETETDEMYFESRKGWNGAAVAGSASRGFYGDVVQDYKLIARDVEADIAASEGQSSGINIVNLIKKEKEKEKEKEVPKPKGEVVSQGKVYKGPDLVLSQEELWG